MSKALEITGGMKLMMKNCLCLHNLSELWIYFLAFPWEIVLGVFFMQLFISLGFRKYKMDDNILKIILVQGVFILSDFVLIIFCEGRI